MINKAVSFEGEHEHPQLSEFLEEVALVADIDRMDESENRVTLMTLHSAKGLEFPRVYLSGMEDGLFPSMMSISSDNKEDVEEERRLCYVGITRAQKFLMMTGARQRMVNGETRYSKISRFVEEIPAELLDSSRLEQRLSSRAQSDFDDSGLPWEIAGQQDGRLVSAALDQAATHMPQKHQSLQRLLDSEKHLQLKNRFLLVTKRETGSAMSNSVWVR